MTFKPFIFPSQMMQLFFFENLKKLGWKILLWKEAGSRREVEDVEDVFITTIVEPSGLNAPIGLP
jgi:hypothetical protein